MADLKKAQTTLIAALICLYMARTLVQMLNPLLPFAFGALVIVSVVIFFFKRSGRL